MDPLLWIKNDKYFGEGFEPNENEIHVLVVVPRAEQVCPIAWTSGISLASYVDGWAYMSSTARTNQFYDACCSTWRYRRSWVIASHLFRRKNEFLYDNLMGFGDIDDVRNNLMLFKPLEHAFDHLQISFIYNKGSNEFCLKVSDQSLRRQRLFGKLNATPARNSASRGKKRAMRLAQEHILIANNVWRRRRLNT